MLSRRQLMGALTAVAVASPASVFGQGRPSVVASFSILADMVSRVGGEHIAVSALVGSDGDAHVYQPSPADARAVAGAKVLVVNGLGFEGWMNRLVRAADFSGITVVASNGVKPRDMEEEEGHGHGGRMQRGVVRSSKVRDPHAWQDLANGKLYVRNIRDALAKADPAHAADYASRAEAYIAELDAMDREVRAAIARIAPEKRKVITSHDAFGYFGAAYGVEFIGAVGISTEAEASASDVAKIVRQIRKEGVKAIFVENMTNPRLIEQISKEAGGIVGGTLYADALSPSGGEADSYLKMFSHNVKALVEGMAKN